MATFGKRSLEVRSQLDPRLQEIMDEAIKVIDFSMYIGHRSNEEQTRLYNQGRTTPGAIVTNAKAGESLHNLIPSKAVDAWLYPIEWHDREGQTYFAGIVKGIAFSKGIKLRWGGDWNRNGNLDDDGFDDLPHFEIDE